MFLVDGQVVRGEVVESEDWTLAQRTEAMRFARRLNIKPDDLLLLADAVVFTASGHSLVTEFLVVPWTRVIVLGASDWTDADEVRRNDS